MDYQSGPPVPAKKGARDRLIRLAARHPDWVVGFEDETWWSRLAQPTLQSWAPDARPLRLVEGRRLPKGEPKALAAYGLLVRPAHAPEAVWLRFVDGRPVSGVTTQFLAWCAERLAAQGKTALLLVWDQAGWHLSREVRGWLRWHNRHVKTTGLGVRIVACPLPKKSPWLNPIEPKWVHGKRRVVEPAATLTADALAGRVCAAFNCQHEPHLAMLQQVA